MRHVTLLALSALTLSACTTSPTKPDLDPTLPSDETPDDPTAKATSPDKGADPKAQPKADKPVSTQDIKEFDSTDPANRLPAIASPFSPALTAKQSAVASSIQPAQKNGAALRAAALKAIKANDYAAFNTLLFDEQKDGGMYCPEDDEMKRRARNRAEVFKEKEESARRNAFATCVTMNIGQATLVSDTTTPRPGTSFSCTDPYEDSVTYLRYVTPSGVYFTVSLSSYQFSSPQQAFLYVPPRCNVD